MAAAVLSAAAKLQMGEDVLALLKTDEAPAGRLAAMAAALAGFHDGGAKSCLIDIFSVAGTPAAIRQDVGRGAAEWIAAIAAVLVQAGIAPEGRPGGARRMP